MPIKSDSRISEFPARHLRKTWRGGDWMDFFLANGNNGSTRWLLNYMGDNF